MKQESGKGMIKALILLVIIIGIIVGLCMSISKNIKTQKIDTVVSDMLTIKAKCKVFNENRIRTNKGEEELIGIRLSEVGKTEEQNIEEKSNDENQESSNENEKEEETKEDNNQKDELMTIIDNFKKAEVITEEEYEKYYVLTDNNLGDLKTNVKNEKNSYYLINYETNEVIITKGHEVKYKISEIEKEIEENNNKDNDNKENENEDNDNKENNDENKEE